MATRRPAKKADIQPAPDRGEKIALMEPLRLGETSRHRTELTDLAIELAAVSAGFNRSLPVGIHIALADMVRSMNCYYSNLIEGHDTHPIDIERALSNDYSKDPRKRDLQLEARAHIDVQRWIDSGGLTGRALTLAGIQETHSRFCAQLPDELLWVEEPDTRARAKVLPGALRKRDVQVGQHVAISAGAVPRFLSRLEQAFSGLGRTESILAIAGAHHRLLWIHPFLDGNGRVARLISHASLLESVDSGGIWSIARGLARNVARYKTLLAACDMTRRNDLDGRGHLSEEALAELTRFMLETCIDQVRFMESLMQPDQLRARILLWAEEQTRTGELPVKSGSVLEAVLYRGELPRGDLPSIVSAGERQARRITAALTDSKVLTSEGPRSPLRLAFPATLASRWMPGLFPDR